MRLTPTERDRLLLFGAAELARARRARGLRLNVPEATALIADTVCEAARDGARLAEAVGQVAHVAEQQVGGQSFRAHDPRRPGDEIGCLERGPRRGLRRRASARLGEGPGHRDGSIEKSGQAVRDREPCRIVGRGRGHEPNLEALRRAAQHEPAGWREEP